MTFLKTWTIRFAAAAIAAVLIGVAAIGAAGGPGSVELAVEGRRNANVSVSADSQFVAVAWGASSDAGPTDVYAAVSRDAGRTFARPVRVSGTEGTTSLSGEQPPRVLLVRRSGRDPIVSVIWTAKVASGTTLFQTRSNDGGRTYLKPTPIAGSSELGNRGWESTAVDAQGRLSVVWLDHREQAQMQAKTGSSPHQHHHEESATGVPASPAPSKTDTAVKAQLSKLYFARLDGSVAAHPVANGVCYCCKTALATGTDGSLYAAWRHVYPGNIRDIAFAMSRDGGRTFTPSTRVSTDNWELDGCPENGPALAVDQRHRAHVVWPTLVKNSAPGGEPNLALFYAVSSDGQSFSSRQRLPTEGTPNHVQIALADDDSLMVVWEEAANGSRRVVLAQAALGGAGEPRFTRTIVNGAVRAVYPVVAAASDAAILAWTSGVSSTIHVERRPRS